MKKTITVMWMLLCVLFYLKTDIFSQEYIKSLKRITFDSTVDYYPTWSPDGKYIAFGARGPKECHVMKIPSEGGEVTQITNVHSGHPSWSPDGHYIAFDNYNERIVQIVSASGGTPIRIIPQAIPAINNRHSTGRRMD
ncbi:MAG: PD40 domain-containing protein [Candidatus Aminicenantes bacterium]|nr:MAG: PD40 domain-containing protein [Candidatus Aminicenantes bacterium]